MRTAAGKVVCPLLEAELVYAFLGIAFPYLVASLL